MPPRRGNNRPDRQAPARQRKSAVTSPAEEVPGNPTYLISKLLRWFLDNARDIPWRRTLDPYGIWVSEIMLQQTQVKTVIPYWNRWMKALPTIQKLARAREPRVLKLWEGLGYYTRVRNLQKAAKQIVAERNGEFPTDNDSILQLPGIGRYTAGAIASIAFNQPTPIVDGNIIRVVARLQGIRDNPREKSVNERIWSLAEKLVTAAARMKPMKFANSAMLLAGPCSALNQSLMELGATICVPRQPKCNECPLRSNCIAQRDDLIEVIPNLGKRPATTSRTLHTFIVRHGDKYFVRQRPKGEVNGGFWEFPNIEVTRDRTTPRQSLKRLFAKPVRAGESGDLTSTRGSHVAATQESRAPKGYPPTPRQPERGSPEPQQHPIQSRVVQLRPFGRIQHTITRYRITQHIFAATAASTTVVGTMNGKWYTRSELKKLPFVSAQKSIEL